MAKTPQFNVEDFPTLSEEGGPNIDEQYVPEFVPLTAGTLNLEAELLEQYNRARRLLHEAQYDNTISLNQKAAALNSATAIIGALTKNQAELYSLERIKKIEAVLIEVLKAFPDMQAEFMVKYEEALGVDE
jgi:hypothetical protein